ncbi:phosphotransferase family protein [Actinocrinis puniceicyclus]|uniref:Phosphotransferase family protein n=1 Tax=Actinocrinis puniceicyclus TaxID=977794 RepID=A0A8J8BDP7_9ACTN|nr:phosphotransferase family protein [Actinocrinis puniceicyclus]MBS2964386.1 phosphotransferase family protein [Actinocrinis puniceicyclus]
MPQTRTAQTATLDAAALARWAAREVPALGLTEPRITPLAGGRSNLSYRVDAGAAPLVLRRPPLGRVLATAHDVHREYRALAALSATDVPVPEPVALCEDTDVIGAPFFLMNWVDGRICRSPQDLAQLAAGAPATAAALADTLAALHRIDPAAVGLADFGRPAGYLNRQVARWHRQTLASRDRRLPDLDSLARRLAESVPEPRRTSIVHGDYRLDNVLLMPAQPTRIAAVLDWEMSTLGDPLADLGLLCVYWDGLRGLEPAAPLGPGTAAGWPGHAELIERYARCAGTDVDGLDWYLAFAYFKIAAILDGVDYRARGGFGGDEEDCAAVAASVPEIAARGHRALRPA